MRGILFIISSPSGGGKGTLIREVLRTVPNIGYSVSFTTRQRREGEVDGTHYNFVSHAEFENLIEQGEFLEYAPVHGNYYGTSRTQVEREISTGRDIILEIDVQGADLVREKTSETVEVFILPPSFEVLRERLIARQSETDENLALRLKNSLSEVRQFDKFDYVIINDEVEKAVKDLQSVIYAERCRRARQTEAIENILQTFENYKANSIGDWTLFMAENLENEELQLDDLETSENAEETIDEIPEIDSKYRMILLAAQRSKQLQRGATPRVSADSRKTKPTRIAMEEFKQEKVKFKILEQE